MVRFLCALIAAGAAAAAYLGAASGSGDGAVRPGTYHGTVRMVVKVGRNGLPATLAGTWSVAADKAGHLRGTEQLRGQVTFPSPDSVGCTYAPARWKLAATGTLGRSYTGAGTPGVVRGAVLLIDVSLAWSTAPDSYTRTCGSSAQPWTFVSVLGGGGDTVTPPVGTLRLPVALLTSRGRPYTVRFSNTWGHAFVQTYTLVSGPK